jgi:hypothetical protein
MKRRARGSEGRGTSTMLDDDDDEVKNYNDFCLQTLLSMSSVRYFLLLRVFVHYPKVSYIF